MTQLSMFNKHNAFIDEIIAKKKPLPKDYDINPETDTVDIEDLEAAAEMYDRVVKVPSKKYDVKKIIATLDKRIESAQKKADNISTEVLGNWTRKRGREADRRRKTKEVLESRIMCLKRLATAWFVDGCPEILKEIRSVSDIESVLYWGYPQPLDGTEFNNFLERHAKQMKVCERLNITESNQDEFKALLNDYCTVEVSEEEQNKKALQKAVEAFRGIRIPGFFPTPDLLIDKMLDYADIQDEDYVLEPSAGIGSIADRIRYQGIKCKIDCVEISPALAEILSLKGYNHSCEDILETTDIKGKGWDKIIMNPPFEKGQDVEHITHCFNHFLKDNGTLVSVASNGVTSNTQKKYETFRKLVSEHGEFVKLEGNEFKGTGVFNTTGISTVLVILNKPL